MIGVGMKALVLCLGLGLGYGVGVWWRVDGYRRSGLGHVLCTYDMVDVFGLVLEWRNVYRWYWGAIDWMGGSYRGGSMIYPVFFFFGYSWQ